MSTHTIAKILLGFELGTGEVVYMKLHHTVVTGMTQLSGKTTTLEAIIYRSGLRAITFTTKRGETGFQSYRQTIPFFKERSDWQYVQALLEATMKERMRFERSWIIKASKGTHSLEEVYENVKQLKLKTKNSLSESVYETLEAYLAIVIPQLKRFTFSHELKLEDGINVMDLTEMSLEMRSLVIRSVMEEIMENQRDIIIVIPEAWEYIPQGRNTPVKLLAESFIRKGASINNYLFLDSQDLAGIDKTPLRQCDNWILGRQKETHEVERLRDTLGKKVSEDEIRALQLGQFIAFLGDEIKKVYVLPANVPEDVGRDVAIGKVNAEYVKENYMSRPQPKEEEGMSEVEYAKLSERIALLEAVVTA